MEEVRYLILELRDSIPTGGRIKSSIGRGFLDLSSPQGIVAKAAGLFN